MPDRPNTATGMCPHCDEEVEVRNTLTVTHDYPKPFRKVCPGSGQHPRCARPEDASDGSGGARGVGETGDVCLADESRKQ